VDEEDKANTLLREVQKVLHNLGYQCVRGFAHGDEISVKTTDFSKLQGWDPTLGTREWILILRRKT
jgi:hypothetical protein